MIPTGRATLIRIASFVLGLLAIVLIIGLTVRSCDARRSKAAQTRLEHSQAQAASDSAKDAIDAVARSGEASANSEALTRSNEKEIHDAEGANTHVGAGVDVAGRRSLCRRAAYRDDPKCRVFDAPAK